MVLSQLLLTAFVVQWLVSQYNSKKMSLHKDLVLQFEKSQEQVLDTLLEKNFINPLLNNKNGFKVSMIENNNDSVHGAGKVKMFFNKIEHDDSGEEIVTVTTDSFYNQNKSGKYILSDSTKAAMLHGVRLVVKEFTGEAGRNGEFEKHFYSTTDTTLFRNILAQHFKGNGWNFNTKWVSKNLSDSSKGHDKIFFLESTLLPESYGLEIAGFNLYLFKQILPQTVFALILLMLTGFAFVISHRSIKKQVRLNTMKNDFIDNISHELKTPLSTVKVVVEALQDDNIRKDDKTMKEYLEMASVEISRLEMLTGKVLSTSMLEGGIIKMQNQEIDLQKLVAELISTLKVRLIKDSAKINFEISGDHFYIHGDPLHIQGAILNIMDNSLKYSEASPEINISMLKKNNEVVIKIKDNGPGISQEYLKKIFDKFFRVPSGNLHNIKGHGLGLSYVDMVMKLHGGSVQAENDIPKGIIFTLIFPGSGK